MRAPMFLIVFLLGYGSLNAQIPIDSVSNQILKNNKKVIAYKNYIESLSLSARTGILPKNPEIEFNFLFGKPTVIGNQTEFAITQTFDFPTVYIHRGNLSNLQIQKADLEYKLYENEVLLQIKLVCIEQIYLNRKKSILRQRFENETSLNSSFMQKFQNGEISQIEVNKSQMQLLNTKNQLLITENRVNLNNRLLTQLNGDAPVILTDTTYLLTVYKSNIDDLLDLLNDNNVPLKIGKIDALIAEKEISLEKSNSLPKIELGYMQERIGNQSLKGVHTGVSIPLWENKNRVKAQRLKFIFQQQEFENLQSQKKLELQKKFLEYQQKQVILDELNEFIMSNNSPVLLKQQLERGLISTTEYYTELSNFYQIVDNYEDLQKDYFALIAKIKNMVAL